MGKREQPKCNHTDTEDTLIINNAHKSGKYVMLRQGVLLSFCNDCETELNQYVCGGLLFNVPKDN